MEARNSCADEPRPVRRGGAAIAFLRSEDAAFVTDPLLRWTGFGSMAWAASVREGKSAPGA